jgi:hypothetical protein
LPREWLDTIAPGVRVVLGVLFIAWSWVSTIIIVGWLLEPLLHDTSTIGIIADRFLVAFVIAFLVSIAEFVSAERWPGAYWIVLLLADASFTAFQTRVWLTQIIAPRTTITLIGDLTIWVVAIVGGIIAAKFGELLLFGRRRG